MCGVELVAELGIKLTLKSAAQYGAEMVLRYGINSLFVICLKS